ncbi:MAG: ion transporter [Clostridia bacterium]|nr:ion transporter [Clostridia bacterium]
MRKKIFEIIEETEYETKLNHAYDIFMILTIILSMSPLVFKDPPAYLVWTERVTTVIFIIDYLLRFAVADIKLGKGKLSFLLYPFTAMAIVDLLSILPTFIAISDSLRVLRSFRLIRALKVIKIFKSFRYSKNIAIIVNVFKRQRRSLTTVGFLAVGYILVSALVVFNVEPETFNTFFDAVYWATVSLTTVGYGDIYAVSVVGRVITMLSAVLGVAIVALPAGIITAGYMSEIQKEEDKDE